MGLGWKRIGRPTKAGVVLFGIAALFSLTVAQNAAAESIRMTASNLSCFTPILPKESLVCFHDQSTGVSKLGKAKVRAVGKKLAVLSPSKITKTIRSLEKKLISKQQAVSKSYARGKAPSAKQLKALDAAQNSYLQFVNAYSACLATRCGGTVHTPFVPTPVPSAQATPTAIPNPIPTSTATPELTPTPEPSDDSNPNPGSQPTSTPEATGTATQEPTPTPEPSAGSDSNRGSQPTPTPPAAPEPTPKGPFARMPAITWKKSYYAGTFDNSTPPRERGGTEMRSLVVFDGKIFAANGYWTDPNWDTSSLPGAQIFVLNRSESIGGSWEQDFQLTERIPAGPRRFFTIAALQPITFFTDGFGNPLASPVELLLASVWDRGDGLSIFSRDTSGPQSWRRTELIPESVSTAPKHVRSFTVYRDKVTGGQFVFAGTSGHHGTNNFAPSPPKIYSGVYDSNAPGKIRWSTQPDQWDNLDQRPNVDDRVMSFVEANGRLFATVCGKLFQRIDGAEANGGNWKLVYAHPGDLCDDKIPGNGERSFRGATAIPRDDGLGEDILLPMEGLSLINRVEPLNNFRSRTELALQPFLEENLKVAEVGYTIPAYNSMLPIQVPGDGRRALMFGIEAKVAQKKADGTWPDGSWYGWTRGAWYIIRYADAQYELRQVIDRSISTAADKENLVATRSMVVSPFPEDKGRVLYAGGFDCNGVEGQNHNTAWIYRGSY